MENETASVKPGNASNRLWWIIGGVLLICCCVSVLAFVLAGPAIFGVFNSVSQGGGLYSGIADEQLKNDVLNTIIEYEAQTTGCTEASLFMGQLVNSPDQSTDGSWSEVWQVTACGASHVYSITFTPSPGGGTDFSVIRAD